MGVVDFFNNYIFDHFFSICFGLGCGLILYRPYYSIVVPSILSVFLTLAFECACACFGLPAHTKDVPYQWKDVLLGYCVALFVAILHLRSYHVYTLSYGWGIAVFAIRGAMRK
ncbi:hypothetical protein IRJ41_005767 [Triplophysa rosa]|uniref:Uncharacterized protein n=1 Tax=Triplophysa rosa TaxID=992332 RepID=A0A9W7TEF8_TRIRA|nr:hypothetical protein IRJ41_005767 [Triplophysa rosa]